MKARIFFFALPQLFLPHLTPDEDESQQDRVAEAEVIYQNRIIPAIALAHLTDWSAELIANTVNEWAGSQLSAESVWDVYYLWREILVGRLHYASSVKEAVEEYEALRRVMAKYKLNPKSGARILSRTPRPVNVDYTRVWRATTFTALIPGDTTRRRDQIIERLSKCEDSEDMLRLTTEEHDLLCPLGSDVSGIIIELLQTWGKLMNEVIKDMPFSRKIRQYPTAMTETTLYTEKFGVRWEAIFGKMGVPKTRDYYKGPDGALQLNITSSVTALSLYFFRMLCNRMEAMDLMSALRRQKIGYEHVEVANLPEDVCDCSICLQPLGEPDPEGTRERPVKLLFCCGNYLGMNCMKKWFMDHVNSRCPICRQPAPENLIDLIVADPLFRDPEPSLPDEDPDVNFMDGGILIDRGIHYFYIVRDDGTLLTLRAESVGPETEDGLEDTSERESEDGEPENGLVEDVPVEDGPVEDGPVEIGEPEDGEPENGLVEDSPVEDGQ